MGGRLLLAHVPVEPLDDAPLDEPLDELKPPLPEPPELEVLPNPLLPPLDELAPEEHALWQALHAVAALALCEEAQLDSWSFELQVDDSALGALNSPPGQMQSK
jgi:hypothetical protein